MIDAAPMGRAGVTTFNGLRPSSDRPGDTVAVIGLGELGHLAVQFAAAMGFTVVTVARSADNPLRRPGSRRMCCSPPSSAGPASRRSGRRGGEVLQHSERQ